MTAIIVYSDNTFTTTPNVTSHNAWSYFNLTSYFVAGKIVVNLFISAVYASICIDDVSLIGVNTVILVDIGAPLLNGLYTTNYIHVSLSATTTNTSATIDKIWYNCLNGSSWIYANNQTYEFQTSMTEFVNGNNYNFFAWANDTYGNLGYSNATFTITNIYFFEGLPFNFQQPIDNSMPFAIFNSNKTESNMTTWNWIQLDSTIYGDDCYSFRFDIWINATGSLYSEVSDFLFTTQSGSYVDGQPYFGFKIISGIFGVRCYVTSLDSVGEIENGDTINSINNEFLQYTFTFLYNATVNTYYEKIDIYQPPEETTGIGQGGVGLSGSLGTSTVIRSSVSSIQQNDQLNLNINFSGSGVIPEYHWLTLWSYIPYTINFSPNYVSSDGFKITLNPDVTLYSINMLFDIKTPNFTSSLQELYYINGTFWLWTTATTPPFTYYNIANPSDDTIGVRIANGSTFILRYTGTNGFVYQQFGFYIAQNPSDCYEGLMIQLAFYQDVGDFPNFTYSNIAYKVGTFNFVLKYAHVLPLPEAEAIVTNFSFISILILLIVPMMICVLFFWKRIKFYSVIFGATVDFVVGFFAYASGATWFPLWALFFIGGAIVVFLYLKLSQKTGGRV